MTSDGGQGAVDGLGSMGAAPDHLQQAQQALDAKKVRKPYTISKQRESWTEAEHEKFLEALQKFDRDWKTIEAFVGTKTVIQIRSHAQKYFLKVQKNGTGEHVPPPRPKRRSSQPYPHKAGKQGLSPKAQAPTPKFQDCKLPSVQGADGPLPRTGDLNLCQPTSSSEQSISGTGLSSPPTPGVSITVPSPVAATSQQCGGVGLSSSERQSQAAAPDFAGVYKFLGGVFDPAVSGHLPNLRAMAPIDRETVILLMRNLSVNLSSPALAEQRVLISSANRRVKQVGQNAGEDQSRTSCLSSTSMSNDVKEEASVTGRPLAPSLESVPRQQFVSGKSPAPLMAGPQAGPTGGGVPQRRIDANMDPPVFDGGGAAALGPTAPPQGEQTALVSADNSGPPTDQGGWMLGAPSLVW